MKLSMARSYDFAAGSRGRCGRSCTCLCWDASDGRGTAFAQTSALAKQSQSRMVVLRDSLSPALASRPRPRSRPAAKILGSQRDASDMINAGCPAIPLPRRDRLDWSVPEGPRP